jgi:hypothetical protein
VPQLQRLLQVAQRLDRRVHLGGGGGPDGGGQRAGQVVALQRVVGQLGRRPRDVAVALGEEPRVRGVQPHPLAGQQVAVHGLLQQRVPERVALAVLGDQHVVGDRLAERLLHLGVAQPAGRLQQRVGDPPAGDRGHPGDPLRGGGQPLQPGEQHVGETVRQRERVAAQAGGQQLLGEVRVALRPAEDVADQPLGHRLAAQRPQVVAQLGRGERGQVEALDHGKPDQLAEQRAQRVPAVQVVRPVGRDHGEPLRAQPGQQEGEQVAGGLVGPVQVLDHQQHRCAGLADVAEQPGDRVEELEPAGVVVAGRGADRLARTGDQPAERRPGAEGLGHRRVGVRAPGQLAERLGERQVGQADPADVDAVSDEDDRARGAGPGAQLREQPGLAHAGVAGEQDRRGPAGPGTLHRRGQPGQLLDATDERSLRPQPRHDRHRGTGHRQFRRHFGPPRLVRRPGRRASGRWPGRRPGPPSERRRPPAPPAPPGRGG